MDLPELPQDKANHAIYGAVAGAATAIVVERLEPERPEWVRALHALLPVVALAVGKEVYDAQHPKQHTADVNDALATIAGGAFSVCLVVRF